ncbi:recombinase family protein, partial [Butyribacter sp.]|uniref:recombinase family protein n=1 Tax=Butyribacter sp. TaxID=2822465 RepID=UPI002A9DEE04|nr:recombinase family protein [Butyribacter sp.]
MNEVEKHTLSVEDQKAKIRQRYKGIDTDLIDIIPCITQEDFYNDTSEKRVAVYARVSTDGINQTSSYELQKNHYEDMINKRPGWTLVDIYADEGISGTSLQHRDAFKRLMRDCDEGKVDMIITKSVSRFARNIVECIDNARHLRALNPPI